MPDGRVILILGGGVMQLPAIRAARRMGLHVVVADGNDRAPGRDEADEFEHVDLRDLDGMLEVARGLQTGAGLHAVFTAGTDFSSTVAWVSEKLGLPGIPYETAMNATDKFRMRSVLEAAGVAVPPFRVVEARRIASAAIGRATDHVGLPCVVKPVDSMGARGVVRAETPAEALEYAIAAVEHSRTGRVVIEGYVEGPEFSLDALAFGGTVRVTGFADRHITFPPYFIEMGHTIPSLVSPADAERVSAEFIRGVKALGIKQGAAKGDMKLSPHGPVVGEIAARLSGGYMSGWTYPLSSGVDLTEAAIRVALGGAPGSLEPRWARTSAERALISIPGIVERIDGVDGIRSSEEIAAVFLTRQAGDRVKLPTSNVEKCGNVISVARSPSGACEAAERAVAAVEIVLKPGDQATMEYLFGPPSGPWAFDPKHFPADWQRALGVTGARFDTTRITGMHRHRQSRGEPVRIGRMPAGSQAQDWAWRTLRHTIERLESAGLVTTGDADTSTAGIFWRAALRGGLQGARYALRTCFSDGS